MFIRVFAGLILVQVATFTSGCDQARPIKMPTDTTKEGLGLFTGEKGYLDLTELCGVNQEQKNQPSCPTSEKKQESGKDNQSSNG